MLFFALLRGDLGFRIGGGKALFLKERVKIDQIIEELSTGCSQTVDKY